MNKPNETIQRLREKVARQEAEIARLRALVAATQANLTIPTYRWEPLGKCAMDTAGLIIADPCYVVPQTLTSKPSPDDVAPQFSRQEIRTAQGSDQPDGEPAQTFAQLNFRLGHPGAGVYVSSLFGDGTVTVWGKLVKMGDWSGSGATRDRVTAVFFSFDDQTPATGLPQGVDQSK